MFWNIHRGHFPCQETKPRHPVGLVSIDICTIKQFFAAASKSLLKPLFYLLPFVLLSMHLIPRQGTLPFPMAAAPQLSL